jgi:hypothetical protein
MAWTELPRPAAPAAHQQRERNRRLAFHDFESTAAASASAPERIIAKIAINNIMHAQPVPSWPLCSRLTPSCAPLTGWLYVWRLFLDKPLHVIAKPSQDAFYR